MLQKLLRQFKQLNTFFQLSVRPFNGYFGLHLMSTPDGMFHLLSLMFNTAGFRSTFIEGHFRIVQCFVLSYSWVFLAVFWVIILVKPMPFPSKAMHGCWEWLYNLIILQLNFTRFTHTTGRLKKKKRKIICPMKGYCQFRHCDCMALYTRLFSRTCKHLW